MKTKYIAEDGKTFETAAQCKSYEEAAAKKWERFNLDKLEKEYQAALKNVNTALDEYDKASNAYLEALANNHSADVNSSESAAAQKNIVDAICDFFGI